MLRADLEKVYIEHCIGCNSHKWCTNHDESKYTAYFSSCKTAILRNCPHVTVVENQVPLGFQNKFITGETISQFGKFHFPRIGSFEVYFRGALIFSKIQSMKWPLPINIANKIREVQDTPEVAPGKKKIKSKRLKSALPVKKRKSKKSKKHLRKLKKKRENEYYVTNDQKEKNTSSDVYSREVSNIYRHQEIPQFSVEISQHSDSEQPIPPQDYYKSQSKPISTVQKEPIQSYKDPAKKSPTPGKKIQNDPEIYKKNATPQMLDELEKRYERHSESPKGYSSFDNYDSSSEEDYDFQKHSEEKGTGHLRKMDQHDDLQYRKKSDSSSKENSEDEYQEGNSDSEQYGSDYEKGLSDLDQFSHNSDEKSEESDYKEDKYEEDSEEKPKGFDLQKKSSSEKYSSEEKYSDDENSENYEEDYNEDEVEHPLRTVDKSYNVKLPLAEETKKKITYQNMSDNDAIFTIVSSHPDFMNIKENEVSIEKGKKGKIQLRFAPIFNDEEKKFYLYIDKDDKPWECIEIIAEYEE